MPPLTVFRHSQNARGVGIKLSFYNKSVGFIIHCAAWDTESLVLTCKGKNNIVSKYVTLASVYIWPLLTLRIKLVTNTWVSNQNIIWFHFCHHFLIWTKCVKLVCTASLIKPVNYLKTTKTRRRNNNPSRYVPNTHAYK